MLRSAQFKSGSLEQDIDDSRITSPAAKILLFVLGLAANEDDLRKADAAAKELEVADGLVDLSADLDKLQGRWKLIYRSAFSSRTLGGSRPGPPTERLLPITLGQFCF
ncbi:hypothetical protein Ahy_A05g023356 isoform C [Arachis hypogaea]|uniref:Plastid lipid-associated protein/fibrillin conserved domain-containing protein n=1 Tax=Arachis hypogaea TaxID=3818 RepID=A0A445D330_ARAHY|nr:hypothetical protein Ahy_A05g023356 isoform C [Arachis hypogaea]